MCTLPQGATNSVAHMMNAMNKVLRDCISEIMMPFLNDIPMKGCAIEEEDETMDDRGCRKFVVDHIRDCEKVLRKLEDVHLTLSGEKTTFGQEEILVVGHLCGTYGQRTSPTKIDEIQAVKEICESQSEVCRFLGACAFYHISSDLEHFEEMLLEFRDELRSTITNHTVGKTMMLKYLMHNNSYNFFTSDFFSAWHKICHLSISIYQC